LNRLRDSARRSELLAQHGEQAPSGAPPAAAEHALLIGELWRQLPDDLLEIGVYYHVDGMSHDEIAAILGVSRRTIGNRLEELTQRARALIEV
jgi:RNA polymerase sigma-70 factor (ECF subfamily)